LLATRMVADHISNYENALETAKAIIRQARLADRAGWERE
jgi:hypothetical protein